MLYFVLALGIFDLMWVFVQVIDVGLTQTLPNHDRFNCYKNSIRHIILHPFHSIFYTCGVYLTILLTIIRYIAVCQQNLSRKIISRSKIKIYIVCVLIFSVIWNIPTWFDSEANVAGLCKVKAEQFISL